MNTWRVVWRDSFSCNVPLQMWREEHTSCHTSRLVICRVIRSCVRVSLTLCVCLCLCLCNCLCPCLLWKKERECVTKRERERRKVFAPLSSSDTGWRRADNYRSLLQKNPVKETIFTIGLTLWLVRTGWRRPIGCLKLQVLFRKRATHYRALLRKMTCKD